MKPFDRIVPMRQFERMVTHTEIEAVLYYAFPLSVALLLISIRLGVQLIPIELIGHRINQWGKRVLDITDNIKKPMCVFVIF